MSKEDNLTQLFVEGAKKQSTLIRGRICKYRLDGMGYTVDPSDTGKTGTCQILDVYYSLSLDCNVYSLRDLSTNKVFSPCEFEVYLEDM